MNLGFCPIASSSKGNSYLIRSEESYILLDAGLSGAKLKNAAASMKLTPADFDGILITHEHVDHVRGAKVFMKKTEKPMVYATEETLACINQDGKSFEEGRMQEVIKDQPFFVGDIEVMPFGISHDAADPVAYSFQKGGKKISIVTDTGKVTDRIEEAIKDSDILVIEANHEVNILLYGSYPYSVKHRILSDVGHLSNEAAGNCIADFLKDLSEPKIPYVYLAHLSKENNTPQQALLTIRNILEENDFYVGKHLKMEVLNESEMGDLIVI